MLCEVLTSGCSAIPESAAGLTNTAFGSFTADV
jgi:hypothetical protein